MEFPKKRTAILRFVVFSCTAVGGSLLGEGILILKSAALRELATVFLAVYFTVTVFDYASAAWAKRRSRSVPPPKDTGTGSEPRGQQEDEQGRVPKNSVTNC